MGGEAPDLRVLARAVGSAVTPSPGITITDVTHDSREAGPGVLFVALRGTVHDGHDFVASALGAGSPAVCVEDASAAPGAECLVVSDTRAALAVLADLVHGHPSGHLRLAGVTGTNGKTTVTHLVAAIGRAGGVPSAVAGTIGARIAGDTISLPRTTPEASDLQRLLARMVDAGVEVAAIEVSSHGLALGRVEQTEFRVAAFTNLGHDHLDFHGDMETYFAAKRRLFRQAESAVVWVDDPWGARLADELDIPCTTVSFIAGDLVGTVTGLGFEGSTVRAEGLGGGAELTVRLAGGFNVANALVAAAIARVLGFEWDTIAAGVSSVPSVPGRFELVDTGKDFTVVVDYAHTPDGVAAAIAAASEILAGRGRVVVVVGAGGDRDRAKRPAMGAAAATAHLAILTSDNPRSEDPVAILEEVASGAPGRADVRVEPDRRAAIRLALHEARPGDAVLVLGKGHEAGQDVGSRVVPFDDRVVVREEASRS